MKGEILHITLKPEDFDLPINERKVFSSPWSYSIYKAMLRKGFKQIDVCISHAWGIKWNQYRQTEYRIDGKFEWDDFLYVKEQYRKDPEMKKCEYYVTLIEQ